MSVDAQQIPGGVIKGLQLRDTWAVIKALATEKTDVCLRGPQPDSGLGLSTSAPRFLVLSGRPWQKYRGWREVPWAALPQEEHVTGICSL